MLLWALPKLLATYEAKQNLFAAQCCWWLSANIGSQPVLVCFRDNQRLPSEVLPEGLCQATVVRPQWPDMTDTVTRVYKGFENQ